MIVTIASLLASGWWRSRRWRIELTLSLLLAGGQPKPPLYKEFKIYRYADAEAVHHGHLGSGSP